MKLQQSPALGPFMGQLTTFSLVTRLASKDQIARIVTATARNRDSVIDVISIFQRRMPARSIVAASLLPIILRCYIVGGKSTTIELLFSAMRGASRLCNLFTSRRLPIVSTCRKYFGAMFEIASALSSCVLFWMCALIVALPVVSIFGILFLIVAVVFATTFSAPAMQSAIHFFSGAKEFKFTRKPLLALGTALIGDRLEDHCNLSSLHLDFRGGPASRKAVVERFMRPFQAQINYIIKVAS